MPTPGSFFRASCGIRKASYKQRTKYCTVKLVGQTCGRRKREGWFEYLHAHRFPWGPSMLKPLKPLNKSNLGHIGLGCAAPASVRGRALLCMYFVVCSCATENLVLRTTVIPTSTAARMYVQQTHTSPNMLSWPLPGNSVKLAPEIVTQTDSAVRLGLRTTTTGYGRTNSMTA